MLPAEGVGIPLHQRQELVGQLQQCRRFRNRGTTAQAHALAIDEDIALVAWLVSEAGSSAAGSARLGARSRSRVMPAASG